jgi:rhodanese-related sulfurtransferase
LRQSRSSQSEETIVNLSRIFAAQQPSTGVDVDPAEARRRQVAGAVLVDVREPEEWAIGRAVGARHIPLGQLSRHIRSLPTDRDVLFICQSGSRSSVAVQLARRSGHSRAFNVRGGMGAWLRAGLPVER